MSINSSSMSSMSSMSSSSSSSRSFMFPELSHLIKWRDGRLQKALRFASEEDGVRCVEEDRDSFVVDSDT